MPLFLDTGLHDWRDSISEFEFRQLFAGRTRNNCYFCFYQRLIEFIWLHDTHPILFDRAVEIEESCGSEDYGWKQGYKLRDLPKQRDRIIQQRAKKIADYVEARIIGTFSGIELDSEISLTSCGLLCGK